MLLMEAAQLIVKITTYQHIFSQSKEQMYK